jgi:hypothetical protein
MTFINLQFSEQKGEKISTKMKTTKFTQLCISLVPKPHRDQGYGAPVLNLYFSAHAYPCGCANICQCLFWGQAFRQPTSELPWLSPSLPAQANHFLEFQLVNTNSFLPAIPDLSPLLDTKLHLIKRTIQCAERTTELGEDNGFLTSSVRRWFWPDSAALRRTALFARRVLKTLAFLTICLH